jgi:putative membrane protein
MKIFIEWILKTLTLLVTAYLVPGFMIDSYLTALIVAIVLSVLNILLKPVLIILTLPFNIMTLGLFTFVINAVLLYIASQIVRGFHIESFFTAIVAAIVITLVSSLLNVIFK